jgi:hypothetical protein
MNQRNDQRQFQIGKRVVPHRAGGFCCKPAFPIIRMQPVADFDFVSTLKLSMKKAAITDQKVVSAKNNCELRRQTSFIPGEKFLQHGLGLFMRVRAE